MLLFVPTCSKLQKRILFKGKIFFSHKNLDISLKFLHPCFNEETDISVVTQMQFVTPEMLSNAEQLMLCYFTTAQFYQLNQLQTCKLHHRSDYTEAFTEPNDDCLSNASTEKNVRPSRAAIHSMRRVNSRPSKAAVDAMNRVSVPVW